MEYAIAHDQVLVYSIQLDLDVMHEEEDVVGCELVQTSLGECVQWHRLVHAFHHDYVVHLFVVGPNHTERLGLNDSIGVESEQRCGYFERNHFVDGPLTAWTIRRAVIAALSSCAHVIKHAVLIHGQLNSHVAIHTRLGCEHSAIVAFAKCSLYFDVHLAHCLLKELVKAIVGLCRVVQFDKAIAHFVPVRHVEAHVHQLDAHVRRIVRQWLVSVIEIGLVFAAFACVQQVREKKKKQKKV